MAPLAAADFELAITLLDKMASAASACSNGKAASATAALDQQRALLLSVQLERDRHAPITRAAFSKLLQKKVPYRLAAGCCTVLGSCGGAASSSAHVGSHAQQFKLISQTLATVSLAALLSSNETSRHTAALCQQLQQSGILQLLPQLLDAAADWLQANASSSPQQSDSSSHASSSNPSVNNAPFINPAPSMIVYISCLLEMVCSLNRCWPTGVFHAEVAPGCALPALRCAWRAHQHLSRHLQHSIEQESDLPVGFLTALGLHAETAARGIFSVLAISKTACSASSIQQFGSALMSSEALLPCLAVSIAIHTLSLLLDSLGQLPQAANPAGGTGSTAAPAGGISVSSGSSSRGSVNSSSSTHSTTSCGASGFNPQAVSPQPSGVSGRLSAEIAWQLACRERRHVPSSHKRLLGLLGCEPTAVLALAALSLRKSRDGAASAGACLTGSVMMYKQLADHHDVVQSLDQPRETCRLHGWQAELHLLIPAVLLHWLAHHPSQPAAPTSPDAVFIIMSFTTCGPMARVREVPSSRFQAVLVEVLPWVLQVGSQLLQAMGVSSATGSSSIAVQPTATSSTRSTVTITVTSSSSSPSTLTCSPIPFSAVQLLSFWALVASHAGSGWTGAGLGLGNAVQIGRLLEASVRACPTALKIPFCLQELANEQGVLFQAATQASTHLDGSSRERRQLAGLWLSALKAVHTSRPPQLGAVCFQAAAVACSMLQHLLHRGPDQQGKWPVTDAIPWLVLLGRSLLLHTRAANLQDSTAALSASSSVDAEAAVPAAATPADTAMTAAADTASPAATPATAEPADGASESKAEAAGPDVRGAVYFDLAALQAWLQAKGVVQQMSAAGYGAEGLLQLWLQQPESNDRDMFSEPVSSWLRLLGLALSNLPFPGACNNAACTNLAGQRELQLVNGRSCICAGCRVARYCSRACQRAAWQEHKPVCKRLAAAAASAAQAAGSGGGGEAGVGK